MVGLLQFMYSLEMGQTDTCETGKPFQHNIGTTPTSSLDEENSWHDGAEKRSWFKDCLTSLLFNHLISCCSHEIPTTSPISQWATCHWTRPSIWTVSLEGLYEACSETHAQVTTVIGVKVDLHILVEAILNFQHEVVLFRLCVVQLR